MEKFSIIFEAILDGFKASTQTVADMLEDLEKPVEIEINANQEDARRNIEDVIDDLEGIKPIDIDLGIDVEKFKNQLTNAQKDILQSIKEIEDSIAWQQERVQTFTQLGWDASGHVGMIDLDVKELEDLIDRFRELPETIAMANTGFEELNENVAGIRNEMGRFFNDMKDNISKNVSQIKRFTLALFGIQSLYRMLSRASHAYLSQDRETARKLQSAWIGLGSIFAPLLEKVADFVIKAVKYLDIFWKAFTGHGFLAKAMEKAVDGANKSVKSLNKSLASFDEITNLDAGGALAEPDWVKAFKDTDIDLGWAQVIQDFGTWFTEEWPGVIALLASTYTFIKLIGVGLSFIQSLQIAFLLYTVILLVQDLIKYFKDPTWENITNVMGKLGLVIAAIGLAFLSVKLIVAGVVVIIVGFIAQNIEIIRETFAKFFNWIREKLDGLPNWVKTPLLIVVNIFEGIINGILFFIENLAITFQDVIDAIKLILSGDFKGAFEKIWKGIANFWIRGINWIIDGLNKISFTTPSWLPGIGGKHFGVSIERLKEFSEGTNRVTEDMVAVIHQGEAIVPEKFNKDKFFGRNNDEAIIDELRELRDTVDKLQVVFQISEDDIGRASVKYINRRRRVLGTGVL